MIRIVHVISDLDTGGAEVMVTKLVGRMDREQFSNTVISLTDHGELGDQIEMQGVPVHALGMKRGRVDFAALPRLIRLLKSIRPDIVQSWLYHADFLSTLAVRMAGSSLLIWNVRCSDMDLTRYRSLTRWIQRILAWWSHNPEAVVVNSQAGKSLHERLGYRPKRWEVIPNGFDLDRFCPRSDVRSAQRKEWGVSDGTVVIGVIARLDPMKDHATFLEAARRLANRRRDVLFVLMGRDTEKLAAAVAEKGLTDQVRLLGYREDVEQQLPGMDTVCLSSAFGEGFPNVLGEAMACGIPCVVTDVGDAGSIVGETGLVVPPRNAEVMAEAMMTLVDEGREARRLRGAAARKRIQSEYSLARITDRYQQLYRELCSTP